MACRAHSAAVVALLMIACNGLTGVGALDVVDEPSTSRGEDGGLETTTSGVPDTGSGQSGSDGGASGDTDTGVDVSSDASPPSDADAAPLGFCASLAAGTADVCTDFDDLVFPGPWQLHAIGLGTGTSVMSPVRSSPRAVQFVSPASATASGSWFSKNVAVASPTEIILRFSFQYSQLRSGQDTELLTILLAQAGADRYETQLELDQNGTLFWEEETPIGDGSVPQTKLAIGSTVPANTWRSMKLTLSIAQASSTITFEVEGSAAYTKAANAHLYKAAPTIVIGDNYASTSAYNVTFDDIYYRVK